MSYGPLQLDYDPYRGFLLTVNVTFNRRSYNYTIENRIYQEQIIQAVEAKWSNTYHVSPEIKKATAAYFKKFSDCSELSAWHQTELPFRVMIKTDPLSGVYANRVVYLMRFFSKKQRPIPIFLKKTKILPSHVGSGLLRRFWGLFRYGRVMCMGLNWSRCYPGFAVINQYAELSRLGSISAHEFGHLFGLDDAYAAWYRLYYPAEGTENFMMHYNRRVHHKEISMLIQAYTQNRMQFFPVKWNWQNIKKGFKEELQYYLKKLSK